MNLPDAMASVYANYATGSGRAERSEYWWFYLTVVTVYAVAWGGAQALSIAMYGNADANGVTLAAAVIALLWLLVNIISTIAVTVRRLHDVGLSGWYYFLHLIPSVSSLVLFVITLLPGTRGSNRYGRDPRNASPASWRSDAGSSDFGDPRFGSSEPYRDRLTPTSALTPITFARPGLTSPGSMTPSAFAAAPVGTPQQYPPQPPPPPCGCSSPSGECGRARVGLRLRGRRARAHRDGCPPGHARQQERTGNTRTTLGVDSGTSGSCPISPSPRIGSTWRTSPRRPSEPGVDTACRRSSLRNWRCIRPTRERG